MNSEFCKCVIRLQHQGFTGDMRRVHQQGPYLFVFPQTIQVAHGFAALFQLQHERFAVAVRATVGAARHRKVIYSTEAVKAGVTAHLVDSAAQYHLMFALQRDDKEQHR